MTRGARANTYPDITNGFENTTDGESDEKPGPSSYQLVHVNNRQYSKDDNEDDGCSRRRVVVVEDET